MLVASIFPQWRVTGSFCEFQASEPSTASRKIMSADHQAVLERSVAYSSSTTSRYLGNG